MKHIAYSILIFTMLLSCQDDFKTSEIIIPEVPTPSISVESSIIGKIIDIDGDPIIDTEVILAGETQFSNELGFVQFDRLRLDRYGSLMTAEKTGYLDGFRRISVHAGTTNYVELILLSNTPSHSFDSGDDTIIGDESGVKLTFKSNSISTNSGQAYNGNVNVSVEYINPTAGNVSSLLPGCLQGITTEGILTTLKSYSMVSVELTDDQGQELNIKNGMKVEIEFPVPVNLINNAPSEIPLWHLDEASGLWLEEGKATLIGNVYVGEVSHFSYWNCDVPEDFVTVQGSICTSVNGGCEPLSFTKISVLDSDNEVRLISQTDSDGNFTIFIPKDSEVTIDIIQTCDEVNDQLNIGPFTEDQNLGQIEINSDTNEVQLDVMVTNCDGSSLQNGVLLINDLVYIAIEDGMASTTLLECDASSITVIAYSSDLSSGSELTIFDYSNNINGTLSLCETDLQVDQMSVVATNTQTGETFSELFIMRNNYRSCFQFTRNGTFPDGRDTITQDYFSKLMQQSSNGWVDIEFFHGDVCDFDGSNIIITLATVKMNLGDEQFYLGMSNLEPLNLGLLSAFSAITVEGDASISEQEFLSFGQNIGDIVEGRIFSDSVRPANIEPGQGSPAFLDDDDGTRYTVEINFRVTVKE